MYLVLTEWSVWYVVVGLFAYELSLASGLIPSVQYTQYISP